MLPKVLLLAVNSVVASYSKFIACSLLIFIEALILTLFS